MNAPVAIQDSTTSGFKTSDFSHDSSFGNQKPISEFATSTALVHHIFATDFSQISELEIQNSKAETAKRLEACGQELIQQLSQDPHVVSAFPGVLTERQTKLNEIYQSVLKIVQSGKGLASWFTLLNKISSSTANNNSARLIEALLLKFSSQVGDQTYTRLTNAFDAIQHSLRLYVLQNRTSNQERAIIDPALTQAKSTLRAAKLGDNEEELRASLEQWLSEWARTPPGKAAHVYSMYVLGFLSHVVAKNNLQSIQWERLLIALEHHHASRSHHKNVNDIGTAHEILISSVPLFNVIRVWLTHSAHQSASVKQLHMVALLQMAIAQKPLSTISMEWAKSIDIAALYRAGWTGSRIRSTCKDLIELIRPSVERHELDRVEQSMNRLAQWSEARIEAQSCIEETRQNLSLLASSMVEGAADTSSHQRLIRQLNALLTLAVEAHAISDDSRVAAGVMWWSVSQHLNYSLDLPVWKRYKQIIAAFSQWDSKKHPNISETMRKSAAILEQCLNAQMKSQIHWAKLPEQSPQKSLISSDALVFSARFSALSRSIGEDRAAYAMRNWASRWMLGLPVAADHRQLRDALFRLVAINNSASMSDSIQSGFQIWLKSFASSQAATMIRVEIDKLVDYVITAGESDYAGRIQRGLASEPPQGNHQAWFLGRMDCRWSLLKMCDELMQAPYSAIDNYAWWWQTVVGKNIAAVPVEFVSTYLQHLSDALADLLDAEAYRSIFEPILLQYKRNFAIGSNQGQAELTKFGVTPIRTDSWKKECGSANKNYSWQVLSPDELLLACPDALHSWANEAMRLHTTQPDSDLALAQLMPVTFSLLRELGEGAIEDLLSAWEQSAAETLSDKHTLKLGLLIHRLRKQAEQVSLGIYLLDNHHISFKSGHQSISSPQSSKLKNGYVDATQWFLTQLGMILLSRPHEHAALDSLRLISYLLTDSSQPDMALNAKAWLQLIRYLEVHATQNASSLRQRACYTWFTHFICGTERLVRFEELANILHSGADFVLAENLQEELEWRIAIEGLMCASACKNALMFNKRDLISACITSSSVWVNESPQNWNERSRSLLSVLDSGISKSVLDDFGGACALMSLQLAERDRARAAKLSESVNRFAAIRRGRFVQAMLKLCRITSSHEHNNDSAVMETPIVATLFGLNSSQLEQQFLAVQKAMEQSFSSEVSKKKFMTTAKVQIDKLTYRSLTKLIRASCVAMLDDGLARKEAAHDLAKQCLLDPSQQDNIRLWLDQHKEQLEKIPSWSLAVSDWSDAWIALMLNHATRNKISDSSDEISLYWKVTRILMYGDMDATPLLLMFKSMNETNLLDESKQKVLMTKLTMAIKSATQAMPIAAGNKTNALLQMV
ncbi:MAG: hypothetical protein EAZ37_03245 [Burkholderiales bacterium]|nr:MAG: hypothetical protein EAZ37_03245 [Burkholderiales bacterium]